MVRNEFDGFLKALYDYFDKAPPKVVSLDLWYQEVEKIPAKALQAILKGFYQSDTAPRNLPKAMWAGYYAYKEFNPDRGVKDDIHREDGKLCHNGFLEVARFIPKLQKWAIYRVKCSCMGGAIYNREQLQRQNYERNPDVFQEQPPEWAFICNDTESLKVKCDEWRAYMLLKKRGGKVLPGEDLAGAMPF